MCERVVFICAYALGFVARLVKQRNPYTLPQLIIFALITKGNDRAEKEKTVFRTRRPLAHWLLPVGPSPIGSCPLLTQGRSQNSYFYFYFNLAYLLAKEKKIHNINGTYAIIIKYKMYVCCVSVMNVCVVFRAWNSSETSHTTPQLNVFFPSPKGSGAEDERNIYTIQYHHSLDV